VHPDKEAEKSKAKERRQYRKRVSFRFQPGFTRRPIVPGLAVLPAGASTSKSALWRRGSN